LIISFSLTVIENVLEDLMFKPKGPGRTNTIAEKFGAQSVSKLVRNCDTEGAFKNMSAVPREVPSDAIIVLATHTANWKWSQKLAKTIKSNLFLPHMVIRDTKQTARVSFIQMEIRPLIIPYVTAPLPQLFLVHFKLFAKWH